MITKKIKLVGHIQGEDTVITNKEELFKSLDIHTKDDEEIFAVFLGSAFECECTINETIRLDTKIPLEELEEKIISFWDGPTQGA